MLDIREEQLSVNVNDKVEEGIIDIFKAGNTVQLPVIDDNMHVIGIVDIYDVIANMGKPIEDIMMVAQLIKGEPTDFNIDALKFSRFKKA